MTWPLTIGASAQESDWIQLLLELSLKGAVVLTVTTAVIVLMRRASAATRHLIWTLGIACLLSLPVLQVTLPGWRVPLLPPLLRPVALRPASQSAATQASDQIITADREPRQDSLKAADFSLATSNAEARVTSDAAVGADPMPELPEPGFTSALNAVPAAGLASAAGTEPWPDWRLLLAYIWIAGSVAILGRIAFAIARVRRIARRAAPVSDHQWTALVDALSTHLRLKRAPRLLKTRHVRMPVTCGILRP